MFFSAQATETVISPTDIVSHNTSTYDSWTQNSHVKWGVGYLRVYSESGINSVKASLQMQNKLWYFTGQGNDSPRHHAAIVQEDNRIHTAKVKRAKTFKMYDLWYHRLAHAGEKSIADLSKITTGTPILNLYTFFSCPCCNDSKMTKMIKGFRKEHIHLQPVNRFLMDYGFVCGPMSDKENKGNILSSVDGFSRLIF